MCRSVVACTEGHSKDKKPEHARTAVFHKPEPQYGSVVVQPQYGTVFRQLTPEDTEGLIL